MTGVIIQMTESDFREYMTGVVTQAVDALRDAPAGTTVNLLLTRVDLKQNFGWSKHKINRMIADGELRPQPSPNAKTQFFLAVNCVEIWERQHGCRYTGKKPGR